MRDLIRKRRFEQIATDVALLRKASKGAPAGDPSKKERAEIIKLQHHLRAKKTRVL
jgi:hypothetical protein